MKWLQLFNKSNSIILEFDHQNQNDLESFEDQITEVQKFYQFSHLEEIASRVAKGKRQGLAAITFSNPRKSVLLRALPVLMGKKIPFTLFLRADCIGLNRLPPEEELKFYAQKYPDKFSQQIIDEKNHEFIHDPEAGELFLRSLRSEVGPLPIEIIDPTLFMGTWGKLREIPKDLVEWGINLYVAPSLKKVVENEILFMRHQLGVSPRVAKTTQEAVWDEGSLRRFDLAACVTGKTGAVTQESQWWDLPYWRFST